MNAFINSKTSIWKCFAMNVGKSLDAQKKFKLYVDGWKMEPVNFCEAGDKVTNVTSAMNEIYDGEQEIAEVTYEKYLGWVKCKKHFRKSRKRNGHV